MGERETSRPRVPALLLSPAATVAILSIVLVAVATSPTAGAASASLASEPNAMTAPAPITTPGSATPTAVADRAPAATAATASSDEPGAVSRGTLFGISEGNQLVIVDQTTGGLASLATFPGCQPGAPALDTSRHRIFLFLNCTPYRLPTDPMTTTTYRFLIVDARTGATTLDRVIGTNDSVEGIRTGWEPAVNLVYDPSTHTLLGLSSANGPALVTIDQRTGSQTPLTTFSGCWPGTPALDSAGHRIFLFLNCTPYRLPTDPMTTTTYRFLIVDARTGATTLDRVIGTNDPVEGIRTGWEPAVNLVFGPSNPLIFIPGNPGSELKEGWLNLWPWTGPLFLGKLSLEPPGPWPAIIATDAIRPFIYDSLLTKLTTRGGYHEYQVAGKPSRRTYSGCDMTQRSDDPEKNPSLFVFAYDWRLDDTYNAALLKEYVACVRRFYPGGQVDILAHSNGGLLARRHILDNPDDHHVGRLITLGSPWLGAPKALYALETGKFLDSPLDLLYQRAIRRLAPFWPGLHDLLPSRSYFGLGGKPFYDERPRPPNSLPRGYYDYDALASWLDEQHPPGSHPGSNNRAFHEGVPGQDDWRGDTSGVSYYHLYGVQPVDLTIGTVKVKRAIRQITREGRVYTDFQFSVTRTRGDGTVPLLSLTRDNGSTRLNAPEATLEPFATGGAGLTGHNGMLKNPAVHNYLLSLLRPSPAPTTATAAGATVRAAADLPPAAPAHYLLIQGAEHVTVADQTGRTTDDEGEGFESALPEVAFDQLGDTSFAVAMPRDQAYTVTLRSGREPLSLEVTAGTDTTTTDAIRYLDLSLPANVQARLDFSPQGVDPLRYDADGNGTFETSVSPSVVLTGSAAADVEPPTITASATLEQGSVVLSLAAQDLSGVQALRFSLDGSRYQPYVAPLRLNPAQVGIAYAYADDVAGNRSSRYDFPLAELVLLPTPVPAQRIPLHSGWNWFSVAAAPDLSTSATPTPTAFFRDYSGVVILNGESAPAGSVVEAFSPRGELVGSFTVSTAGRFGYMRIYGQDPQGAATPATPGMRSGEPVSIRVNGYPATTGAPAIWESNFAPAQVDLQATADLPVETALAWISGEYDYLLGEEGTYSVLPPFPGANTLTHLKPGKGYFIRMRAPAELAVLGQPLAATTAMKLDPGWRWVGYLPGGPRDLPGALASLDGRFDYVLGETGTFSSDLPPYLNTLSRMEPGRGYLIRMRQEGTLLYGPAGLPPVTPTPTATPTAPATAAPTPTPTSPTATAAASVTATSSATPAATTTPTGAPAATVTATVTPTATPAVAATPPPTPTSASATATANTPAATATPTPTALPGTATIGVPTPTGTATPVAAIPTVTPIPTATP